MGDIEAPVPHVRRSSSMDFAQLWKHKKLRMISITAIGFIAITFLFAALMSGTNAKKVMVTIDGKQTALETRQKDVNGLLLEKGITVSDHDRLSLALDTPLKNGDNIVISRTAPVQLTMDGATKTWYTTGKTVADVLTELHIALGKEDKIVPSKDAVISGNDSIKIVRVTKQVKETEVPIAFGTVTKKDDTILKGKQTVVQEGKEGTKLIKTEQLFEDGKMVSEKKLSETISADSVDRVVAIGTKVPVVRLSASTPSADEVSKNGVTFAYKKILNNVTLTAYSAGVESTGKDKNDPHYGITYTGTTVMEGRTIAVDKNVIPLGWWVYIEGIGFRRAEDIGSAIKGNKIDIYYDSSSYASKFGMKNGYTVYIIGPKKPSAD